MTDPVMTGKGGRSLILVTSPYFDGIGILYEVALEARRAGFDTFVLDAIEPGLYPEIKNFTPKSALFWRAWRRQQFLNGLGDIDYIQLRTLLGRYPIAQAGDDAADTAVARLTLQDHAICHGVPDREIQSMVDRDIARTARTFARIRHALAAYVDHHQIDRVFTFNGRNPVSRLLEQVCAERGIEVAFLEYFGKRDGRMTYVQVPFDIFDMDRLGEWIAERYAAAGPDREDVAVAALEDRIVNLDPLLQSWNLEGGTQSVEETSDSDKPLISFFFSSEDEYPALKPSRYGLPDPTRQYDTFRQVCETLRSRGLLDACRWEIKLHPRYLAESQKLAGAAMAWERAIAFVQSIGMDLRVHAPTASPYAIIARSALVVSYGSTAWEACYLGKPSVLLGPGPFAAHGCAYDARTVDEIVDHIADIPPPRPRENALPYAWGWNRLGVVPHAFRPIATGGGGWNGVKAAFGNRFGR